MPKTIKEFQLNQSTGEVSVEYSDDSTSKFNAADMVTAQTDPVTGMVRVTAARKDVLAPFDAPGAVSVLDLYPCGPVRAAAFPSPYSAGGDATLNAMTQAQRDYMVHPTVVYAPNAWNGYKYWACVTPYPAANSSYENPCIFASNDKETWVVPTGLTNPIIGKPADGYNADNTLFFSPDRQTLNLVYRERLSSGATGNNLRLMTSTDGINWSAPVTILTGAYPTQDYASPSINWNGSRWELISHNLDNAGTKPVELRVSTTADLTGGWGAPVTLSTQSPRATTWWHSDFKLTQDGYIGIMQDGNSSGGALYFVESSNKKTIAAVRLTASILHYRSAICLDDRDGGVLTAWLGIANAYTINRQEFEYGRVDALLSRLAADMAVVGSSPRLLVKDTFTRADNSASPGSPEIGAAYTIGAGTWGIGTNRLYGVTTGSNRITSDTGKTSHQISAKIDTIGTETWVIAGYIDANNFIRVGSTGGTSQIQIIKAGAVDSSETFTPIANGDTVLVRKLGSRLQVYVNDVPQYDKRIDSIGLGSSVGFQASGAALSYFDNMSVIGLG